jgi:hypothetical protein
MTTKVAQSLEAKEQARTYLMEYLKPGTTVYTILRHVSRSGTQRHISTVVHTPTGIYNITHLVAKMIDARRNQDDGGLIIGGCGMDMGFEVVYRLSSKLWPDGFALLEGSRGRNGDTSGFDRDGGYALKQVWL